MRFTRAEKERIMAAWDRLVKLPDILMAANVNDVFVIGIHINNKLIVHHPECTLYGAIHPQDFRGAGAGVIQRKCPNCQGGKPWEATFITDEDGNPEDV